MPERDGPLLVLAGKLRSPGPPSLAILIARFEGVEDYEDFVALVREYLPECELEILREHLPSTQMALFVDRFGDRYFPLMEYIWEEEEDYSYLTRGIPLIVMGVTGDDYHEIASCYKTGHQLMTYLLHYPYGEEDGGRIALAEACAKHVPPELLQRVPEGGITAEEAHRLLNDTQYKGLAHWADMLSADTGNDLLDITEDDLWSGMELPPWDRETVEHITQAWAQAEVIQGEVMRLGDWLEEDPPARFEELLNFIESRRETNAK
ncbi:hypothetical protein ES703_06142 [subsurface metagenome]